jgi:hypothetical protein
MGATQLLAQLLASIDDPHDEGIAVDDIVGAQSGVSAEVTLPGGDRYVVVVQWIGDREAEAR